MTYSFKYNYKDDLHERCDEYPGQYNLVFRGYTMPETNNIWSGWPYVCPFSTDGMLANELQSTIL